MKKKLIYPLNQNSMLVNERAIDSRGELIHGLRQLNEGIFKYQPEDNYVELIDRMLFIGTYHTFDRKIALAERIKSNKLKKHESHDPKSDIKLDNEIRTLYMEITPEIRPILNSLNKFNKKK